MCVLETKVLLTESHCCVVAPSPQFTVPQYGRGGSGIFSYVNDFRGLRVATS